MRDVPNHIALTRELCRNPTNFSYPIIYIWHYISLLNILPFSYASSYMPISSNELVLPSYFDWLCLHLNFCIFHFSSMAPDLPNLENGSSFHNSFFIYAP